MLSLSAQAAHRPVRHSTRYPALDHLLTPREREVLARLVRGESTTSMARSMGVQLSTTRTHIDSVLIKLGVHSRLEAVAYAVREGIIDIARQPRAGERAGRSQRIMRTSNLLIVDDHRVFCQGLEAVFAAEPDFEPMAISNPDQALGVVAAWRPDVVIMDLRLGEVSGVDLTRQMTALPFPPAVVVLTAYADIAAATGRDPGGRGGFRGQERLGRAGHQRGAGRGARRQLAAA